MKKKFLLLYSLFALIRLDLHAAAEHKKLPGAPGGPEFPVDQHESHVLNLEAYQAKSQQVIRSTLFLKEGLPHNYDKFLDKMISNGLKLKNKTLDIPTTYKTLDVPEAYEADGRVYFSAPKQLDGETIFRWEFIRASSELATYHKRRILKCHISPLESFELPYEKEMQKVTEAEYSKKLETSDSLILEIIIEEAAILAKKIKEDLAKASLP